MSGAITITLMRVISRDARLHVDRAPLLRRSPGAGARRPAVLQPQRFVSAATADHPAQGLAPAQSRGSLRGVASVRSPSAVATRDIDMHRAAVVGADRPPPERGKTITPASRRQAQASRRCVRIRASPRGGPIRRQEPASVASTRRSRRSRRQASARIVDREAYEDRAPEKKRDDKIDDRRRPDSAPVRELPARRLRSR